MAWLPVLALSYLPHAAAGTAAAGGVDGPAWITAACALAAAVLGCLGWLTRRAWHILRRISRFSDDWFGQEARDGLPARPGVMARLGSVEELIERVHAETQANHGTSLRDVVNRTEAAVAGIITEQEAVRADLDKVKAQHAGPMETP